VGSGVSVLAFDPVTARAAARRLTTAADRLFADAIELRARFVELELAAEGWPARRMLERAASKLWHDATFLALVSDRVEAGDAVSQSDAAELWAVAVGPVGRHGLFGPWRNLLGASPVDGDLGGTFDREARPPIAASSGSHAERARALLGRLFHDLADPRQIHVDEFGLVQVAPERYIVVLPGVTDLSDIDLHLNRRHRTVRDLDQHAIGSSRSSSVDDNPYAAMVWQALEEVEVAHGAELMIVGHSYGADTALDLASDPRFNGDRFRVTHVVAAGYYSQPQLGEVVDRTKVLVVQNRRDAAVLAERIGRSSAADAVIGRVQQVRDVVRLDPAAAADRSWEIVRHDLDALDELVSFARSHAGDIGELALGAGTADRDRMRDAATELVSLEPRVERLGDDIVIDVFEGGSAGLGHHPSNYGEHLAGELDPAVVEFLASVGEAGYAGPGSAVAVDVSVPGR
jgi:hypothetical protein